MDMPQNQDFKYVLQDFGNIYIGARYSYEEMLKSEDIPYKWKAIIRHYLLKETSPETTMENHIFFMKEDDFAYETVSYTHLWNIHAARIEDKKIEKD